MDISSGSTDEKKKIENGLDSSHNTKLSYCDYDANLWDVQENTHQ